MLFRSAEYPRLDVLMNNAGIMLHRNLKVPATDLDGLMAEMNTNVGGVIRMTSAFIDILTANKGTVINVSSALAFVPLPSAPIYCATKAAIHSYTQSLRFQLEESGVEVIELMPPEPSSPDRRHFAPSIVDLLHEKFDPEAKQLITFFEPENGQIFVDEDRLSSLGLTLRDLARFLESQPFLFAVFTNDDVRSAANALKRATPTPRHSKYK